MEDRITDRTSSVVPLDGSANIKDQLLRFLPYWPWFLLSVVISFSVAYLKNRYATPTYLVKGTFLIQEEETSGNVLLQELGADLNSSANIQNEIAILSSYSMLMEVIDSLNLVATHVKQGNIKDSRLYTNLPYRLIIDRSNSKLKGQSISIKNFHKQGFSLLAGETEQQYLFGDSIEINELKFVITKSMDNSPISDDVIEIRFSNPLTLAKTYKGLLTIKQLNRESTIIELSCRTGTPTLMVDFINTLMHNYIRKELIDKNRKSTRTIEFIDRQLVGIQNELFTAESQLENFRAENNIIDLSQEGISTFTLLQSLESELALITIQKEYYNYLNNYLSSKPTGQVVSPSAAGIDDAALNGLIGRFNELSTQLITLEASASDADPRVNTLKAQINRTVDAMNENVSLLIDGANLKINDLGTRIKIAERELNQLPGNERKLVNIQRRFSLNENLYVYLLQKKAESNIIKAGNIPSSKVLDQAMIFHKTSPNTMRNYTLAIFLGIALPIGFLLSIWYFKSTISSIEEITSKTKIPLIGSVALNKYESDLVLKDHPNSIEAESFRTIRSNLRFLQNGNKEGYVMMLTSFLSGEGKTFNALNLATAFAMASYRTLLISCDLRKKERFENLVTSPKEGLTDFMIGDASVKAIIQPTTITHLDFIGSGPTAPNPNELLLHADLASLFEYARKQYDYIVVDTSPIGIVSDPIEISKYIDACLFVIRQDKTPKDAIEYINATHKKGLLNKLSIIYNAVDFSKMSYRYGYRNSYNYTKYFDKSV